MLSNQVKNLNSQIEKLKGKVNKFQPSDDIAKDQQDMEDIEDMIKNIEDKIEEIDKDMEEDEDTSAQKPLLNKISEYKNEFNIVKNNYNKKKDEANSAHSQELLMRGELKGVEKKKAQRDMAIDLDKQVDEQGLMLDSIHDHVIGANNNLKNMNVEVKNQGEKLNNIGEKVINMDQSVKKTGQTMGEMERRVCCRKCIVWMGIILLFLMNVIMAFLILAKYFAWPLFKVPIKGIQLMGTEDIDFKKLNQSKISFVMINSGTGMVKTDNFEVLSSNAKENKIDIGTFWTINGNIDESKEQASAGSAVFKTLSNINKNYYFRLEKEEVIKNYTYANDFCDGITYCGLVLKHKDYEDYYKKRLNDLKNIKYYWIDDYWKEFDDEKETQVLLWTLEGKEKILHTSGQYNEYTIIQARKQSS